MTDPKPAANEKPEAAAPSVGDVLQHYKAEDPSPGLLAKLRDRARGATATASTK